MIVPDRHVTLSEGVRRPSRRVPRGLEGRRFSRARSEPRGILRLASLAQNDIEIDHRWRLTGISSIAIVIGMTAP